MRPWTYFSVAGLTALALTGCGGNTSSTTTTTPAPTTPAAAVDFSTTVFVGDSLTAGFQNGSLLETQQPNGWAPLFAKQAGATVVQPLIAAPGVPAYEQLVSVGPPPVTRSVGGTSSGRTNASAQPTDLAVPGHLLHDLINAGPTALPTAAQDILTTLVLGFPVGNSNTQLNEAVALKPTTLFVWIGSNDALLADDSGRPASMTPVASFTTDYAQLMTTLHSKLPGTRLLVLNLPDVTAIPLLTPAATILQEASTQTGQSTAQLGMELGLSAGDLVTAQGQTEVNAAVKAIQGGTTPTALDDAGVLTAAEVQQIQATETQYNQVIAQQAQANGATLVDIHAFFASLGTPQTIDGQQATTAYLGGIFSLDGTHPTNTGYALIANYVITSLNTSLKTTLPSVDANAVAAADPLFGSNIKPVGAAPQHISPQAGFQAGTLLRGRY